jgi:hypothetical protein
LGYSFSQVYTINDLVLVDNIPLTQAAFQRPFGTLFKYPTNPAIYFLNSFRQKRPFPSLGILMAWTDRLDTIINIPDSETYQDGPIVTLPNGMIVKGSGPAVYLVFDGKLRPFLSADAFLRLGYSFSQIRTFTDAELQIHQVGDPLN